MVLKKKRGTCGFCCVCFNVVLFFWKKSATDEGFCKKVKIKVVECETKLNWKK
jgi:hypothetical protein